MDDLLFVVERARPEVYERLRRICADLENVQVILDRRLQARRRTAARLDAERRQAERRVRPPDEELATLGFAIVKPGAPSPPALARAAGAPAEPAPADTRAFLAGVSLFREFSPEQIGLLAERMSVRRLREAQTLFQEGDHGKEMFVVYQGRIVISKDVTGRIENVLTVIGPGDFFGEMNVFGGLHRSATARAEADAVVLELDQESLRFIVERSPGAGLAFFAAMVREFSRRLSRTDDLVAEVTRWGLEATGLDADFE